jgi:hypothetical protein
MNVADANGWYLAQNEYRKWMEDFTDDETGEVVSEERQEVLCGKGTFLNEITVSLLKENGIENVKVSNVLLKGNQEKGLNLWETILKIRSGKGEGKKTYMVTAECPAEAERYISEWHEVNVEVSFEIVKVNKQDYDKVIKMYDLEREEYEKDGTKKVRWYKCQIYVMIDDEGDSSNSSQRNILCQATGFEKAIEAVKQTLGRDEYERIYNTFKLVQEQRVEEVFIPDENVSYYSNDELGESNDQGGFYKAINNLKKAGVTSVTTNIE